MLLVGLAIGLVWMLVLGLVVAVATVASRADTEHDHLVAATRTAPLGLMTPASPLGISRPVRTQSPRADRARVPV